MKIVYVRCAGLDVHQRSVSACVRHGKGDQAQSETALFGTFTEQLQELRAWLRRHRVRRVVMESTGVYWMPVWNVLERCPGWKFDLLLINPHQAKALPGRKTDRIDCQRLAELGQHDLLRGSFIPPLEIRQLRDLTRRRVHLQQDRNRVINRIERQLQTANLKLSSVATNIVGKTGLLVLQSIADGQMNPERLAQCAQGKLKSKQDLLEGALDGFANPHTRWMLSELLDELNHLNTKLAEVDVRIGEQVRPWSEVIQRLCTIPGIQEVAAWTILAELGPDMKPFPDADHAASWAGLCPGNSESAGKRHSGRTRKGNRYLRRMLVQCAWSITHKKDCFLTALFYRIAGRRGMKHAAMAVAHRMLKIAYHIIRDGTVYQEFGGAYFDRLNPEKTAQRLTRRLEGIGFSVTLSRATGEPATQKQPKKRSAPRESPPTASSTSCRKCARWGIGCIHARPDRFRPHSKPDSTDSAT